EHGHDAAGPGNRRAAADGHVHGRGNLVVASADGGAGFSRQDHKAHPGRLFLRRPCHHRIRRFHPATMLAASGPGHWTCPMTLRFLQLAGVAWVCLLLIAGCHQPNSTVLGKAPEGEPRTISSVKTGDAPPQVTLQGVMIEKCPVAGCWFRLRDSTGVIKVDTKLAGFV